MNNTPAPESGNSPSFREPPRFDPGKAAQLVASARDHFNRKELKFARYRMLASVISMVFVYIYVRMFVDTYGEPFMYVSALGAVLSLTIPFYADIRYFILRSQLAVQRSLVSAQGGHAPIGGGNLSGLAFSEPEANRAMSRVEYVLWSILIIGLGVVLSISLMSALQKISLNNGGPDKNLNVWSVIVENDGAVNASTSFQIGATGSHVQFLRGSLAMDRSGLKTIGRPAISDDMGRSVRLREDTTTPNDPMWVFELPSIRYQKWNGLLEATWRITPEREGDLYVLRKEIESTYRRGEYRDSVELPVGAEFVSVEPKADVTQILDGAPRVYWNKQCRRMSKVWYTVKYRLPAPHAESSSATHP